MEKRKKKMPRIGIFASFVIRYSEIVRNVAQGRSYFTLLSYRRYFLFPRDRSRFFERGLPWQRLAKKVNEIACAYYLLTHYIADINASPPISNKIIRRAVNA